MNDANSDWRSEVERGERFGFGENWSSFLRVLDDHRIETAERSLKQMLNVERLDGKRFLDAGSGSGLFSLAARRLGADVHSFDYDPDSVACTAELRRRYFPADSAWQVEQGSVLDRAYLGELGSFDIVYSWGVLHHTGAMWQALENMALLIAPNGLLYIAIYNDQGRPSRMWKWIKEAYVRAPGPLKWAVLLPAFARLWGPTMVRDTLHGDPMRTWNGYAEKSRRGMDAWRDVVDWVGGYPFEVARPEEIVDFYHARGLQLRRLSTCAGGHGCNEYVFERVEAVEPQPHILLANP